MALKCLSSIYTDMGRGHCVQHVRGGSKGKMSISQDGIKFLGRKAQSPWRTLSQAQAGLCVLVLLSSPPRFRDGKASMCLFPCLNCHLFTPLVESENYALWGETAGAWHLHGVGEDNKDICPMAGSQVEGWVQLLAGTSKVTKCPKGPNPVLRDPHGLDQSQ